MKSNQTFTVSSEERAAQIEVLNYHAKTEGYHVQNHISVWKSYNQLPQIQNAKTPVPSSVLFTLVF